MIFPLSLWSSKDPQDALGRIDRALNDRNHRLLAGIAVSEQFDRVRGALVVSQANGKYLRIRHVVEASESIPSSLKAGCLEVLQGKQRSSGQIALLASDLAEIQAAVVERLKCEAGKYVDRVLAVAVCDPGIWDRDFDGKVSYSPFCDATRLAELCGVTVIDSFPARDLAVGGKGRQLESLPYWILFGDRNKRIANHSRTLVSMDRNHCQTYCLPASDGLDSEVPEITINSSLGLGFLDEIVARSFPGTEQLEDMDRLYAEGLQIPELRRTWESRWQDLVESGKSSLGSPVGSDEVASLLAIDAEKYVKQSPSSFSNVIRTGIRWVVDSCLEQFEQQGEFNRPDQLLIASPAQYETGLINQFSQLIGESIVTTTRKAGIDPDELTPVVAAILGLFNVDQMPANVPWLTGASCQRILGSLTPGRPSNWRQLVRVMADFQPAPMKLKDAV